MEIIIKSVILSAMLGISCKEYFGLFLPGRWKSQWINGTANLIFMAGFMLISFSPIPPYFWQPVRLIAVIWTAAWICFRVKPFINILLTLFLSGLIWMISAMTNGILELLQFSDEFIMHMGDVIWCSFLLCVILTFACRYRGRMNLSLGIKSLYFGFFPLLSIGISMAVSVINWKDMVSGLSMAGIVFVGIDVINILAFYFILNIMLKEVQMQEVKLLYERTENQMKLYQSMERNYQYQKRLMHDYKNQLNTIQGLLVKNQDEEALAYIEKLTGEIKKNSDYVDTNHAIVNVVLNQKYQYALTKGITMIMAVNDLSGLTISDEEIVILLVNLLDNAIEACGKSESGRIIRFKMLMEGDELLLSVGNPVEKPVEIKENKVLTTKKDDRNHGIGLLNVDSVVKRNRGTSVIKCSDGWFWFSAMIPLKSGTAL